MIGIFVAYPLGAVLVGAIFLALYRHAARRRLLITGVLWMLYAAYEYGMKQRILCSGECNIRVDLLLLYPLLFLLSAMALISYALFLRDRTRRPASTMK